MPYFLVELVNGPGYDRTRPRREQRGWAEHAAFMDGLVEEGLVVLGGPVGDVDRDHVVVVSDAHSEEAIRARLADDPWMEDILAIQSVRPWTIWLRADG